MKISSILENNKKEKRNSFSFEFFPPKTEQGFSHLIKVAYKLKELNPAFVSITYGAGGSTRQKTRELTIKIQKEIGLVAMAHLTCVGSSKEEILEILKDYKAEGVENILSLRGDPPKGEEKFVASRNGFATASGLVEFIESNFPSSFAQGVAAYPEKHAEAKSLDQDLKFLKEKVDKGASFIITQLFLDNKYFFEFVDKARLLGITVPILAGIMPVSDFAQIKRFTEMIGAKIPQELLTSLEKAERSSAENAVKETGIEWATNQCFELLEKGVDGIHFYTLNKSLPTLKIFENLNR